MKKKPKTPKQRRKKAALEQRRKVPARSQNVNLARLRTIFLLRKTSRPFQSDLLSDGAISAKFGISTSRPATLGNIALPQERLLDAFRQALGGRKVQPLLTGAGHRLKVAVSVQEDGAAVLKLPEAQFVFSHAGLLSPDPKVRLDYLEQCLRGRTLAKTHADALRAKVSAGALSNDAFLEVIETLLTSPEQFVQAVNNRVRTGNLTNTDLLPDDERYWENLIAPVTRSKNLEEFIKDERQAEHETLLKENGERAFLILSLSFCAPGLVPVAQFQALDADALLKMIGPAVVIADHFGVTGAFEICAHSLSRDPRFETVGSQLLDHLLKDMDHLKQRCAFYAAIFALTVARLAQHETLKQKPAFWRRVTAAAHAALVVRACGPNDAEETYSWALGHSGKSFVFSALLEGNEEPRWKPDWLTPKHLVADVFGRIEGALNTMPEEARPQAWVERVAEARTWIAGQNAELLCMFPAIGESARRKVPTQEETGPFKSFLQELYDKPNFDTFITCTPAFYTVGVTDEAVKASHAVLSQLRKEESRLVDGFTPHIIQTLAFVAMQSRDEKLADSVAEFCIEKTRELVEGESTAEIVCRLVECASAASDRTKAMETLTQRLERVAYLSPAHSLIDLYDSLRHLQILDDTLSQSLGKALAASRLGRSAA